MEQKAHVDPCWGDCAPRDRVVVGTIDEVNAAGPRLHHRHDRAEGPGDAVPLLEGIRSRNARMKPPPTAERLAPQGLSKINNSVNGHGMLICPSDDGGATMSLTRREGEQLASIVKLVEAVRREAARNVGKPGRQSRVRRSAFEAKKMSEDVLASRAKGAHVEELAAKYGVSTAYIYMIKP